MVSETIKSLKRKYKNQAGEKIGRDLIQPCLKEAIKYRRGTGTFSSSAFKAYIGAIDHFINDDVKIEILCSPKIDLNLLKVLEKCNSESDRDKILQKTTNEILLAAAGCKAQPERPDYRSTLLAYLIANNKLEIKIALPLNNSAVQLFDTSEDQDLDMDNINTRAMYHIKYGYFIFPDKSVVAFEGSVNETDTALNFNTEKATVYRSWEDKDDDRLKDVVEELDNDWEGRNNDIRIYNIDDDALKIIREQAPTTRPQKPRNEIKTPSIPVPSTEVELTSSNLRPYQQKAIESWIGNDCKGILAMATGSGKTRTAIKMLQEFKNHNPGGLIVVVVPYKILASQWIKEIQENTGIAPVGVFDNFQNWSSQLQNWLVLSEYTSTDAPILVAVNKSFKSSRFQELLTQIEYIKEKNHLLIVDECHHFNDASSLKKLPESFNFRLGLSATPYDQFEDNPEDRFLEKYFKGIVFEYTLQEAITSGYLCPYDYNVIPVSLNETETDEYEDLSKKIGQALARERNATDESFNLDSLISKRTRLLGKAEDKLIKLHQHLVKKGKHKFVLVYCGDGIDEDEGERVKQIEKVSKLLSELNWNVGRISSQENDDLRDRTIDALKREILDAIVSIQVLDEGVDIPSCEIAYILASKRSERVFIQRRGRVLRLSKDTGKQKATIYDFVITSTYRNNEASKKLAQNEFERVYHFAKDALNKEQIFTEYSQQLDEIQGSQQ